MSSHVRAHPGGVIAVVGAATSHALASVRAIGALEPRRRICVIGFDDASRNSALEQVGVREAGTLADIGDLAGVIFADDMARHLHELTAIVDAGVPALIHKPAVSDRATLSLLAIPLLRAPEVVLTGSVLRFAPSLVDVDLASAAVVDVEVHHPLCGRRDGEDTAAWLARIARDFGLHGLEMLDHVGRRPQRCAGVTWDEAAKVLSLEVPGAYGPDRITIMGTSADEFYSLTTDALRAAPLETADDPLGHEATHRAFLKMVAGAPSPVPVDRSLVILAATLDAAEHAHAVASPTKEIEPV